MGLSGEDARIQALFHELVVEDQGLAPSFTSSWRRAESESRQLPGVLWQPLLVIAMAVVVTGLTAGMGFRHALDQRESGMIPPLAITVDRVGPSRSSRNVRVSRHRRRPEPLRRWSRDRTARHPLLLLRHQQRVHGVGGAHLAPVHVPRARHLLAVPLDRARC